MQKLILMVGLPGSGKSTWAKKYAEHFRNFEVVSSDAIRGELWGDENDQQNPSVVFEEVRKRTVSGLCEGRNIIMDATNINAKRRASFLVDIKSQVQIDYETICCVVATLPEVCKLRNQKRERVVPDEVIDSMLKTFQTPYYNEGWDSIWIVRGDSVGLTYEFDDGYDMLQDNMWHIYSIREHCAKAAQWLEVEENRTMVEEALPWEWVAAIEKALPIHDIGKFRTKTFRDKHGNRANQAHFYGHDSVGTYMWLCNAATLGFLGDLELTLRIALIIQWHMQHYNFKNDWKAMQKWVQERGFPEEFATVLEFVANADESAQAKKN